MLGIFYTDFELFVPVAMALDRWADHVVVGVVFGGFTIAIFARGALNVRPIVTRTTIYGTLGVVAFMAFAALESLASEMLEARLGLPDIAGAALSGAVVAGIVLPLRSVLAKRVHRLFE